ncbi:hypothetical protein E3P99_01808 [Wallemia hederae]|uniref:RNA helicase n=1 Tax=Wallemia hederae TaxID=1540922 RepID=A0A4T0FMQ4_9BASI|nr:hypothetical protein E3P99_01808 [Wallemia hederae]
MSQEQGWITEADAKPAENVTKLADRIGGLSTEQQPAEAAEAPASSQKQPQQELEVSVTLADQQADPNSPLYSARTFEELGLHENLLKGIYAMKFQKPSKIQERALPLLLQNPLHALNNRPRNMIAQSQSGTGKTAAFALAILSRINYDSPNPQAVVLSPSRELARQTMSVIQQMGQFTNVKTAFAIKDAIPKGEKVEAQVIVATPGALVDAVRKGQIYAKEVKVFVLDEADNMLDQHSMGDQSIKAKNLITSKPQILLFSATFPDVVRNFAAKFAPAANEIRLKQEELSVEGIKQFYMDCDNLEHKFKVLVELYELMTVGQSIIFVHRRDTADEIARRMTSEGHTVVSLHGKQESSERDLTIDSFREGKTKVLITTNVIARGIDISQVNMVINYDMPKTASGEPDSETYLHRIGRTGRFGRKGIAVNFIHDPESWKVMNAIEIALKKEIIKVETQDFDAMEAIIKKELKD